MTNERDLADDAEGASYGEATPAPTRQPVVTPIDAAIPRVVDHPEHAPPIEVDVWNEDEVNAEDRAIGFMMRFYAHVVPAFGEVFVHYPADLRVDSEVYEVVGRTWYVIENPEGATTVGCQLHVSKKAPPPHKKGGGS